MAIGDHALDLAWVVNGTPAPFAEALTSSYGATGEELARGRDWHLLGPLQTNKARQAAKLFRVLHAVDRLKVAHALAAERDAATPLDVFLEVNLGAEPTKHGFAPGAVAAAAREIAALSGLRLVGLMAIPPEEEDPEAMLDRVPIPPENVHPIPTDGAPEDAAGRYERTLQEAYGAADAYEIVGHLSAHGIQATAAGIGRKNWIGGDVIDIAGGRDPGLFVMGARRQAGSLGSATRRYLGSRPFPVLMMA